MKNLPIALLLLLVGAVVYTVYKRSKSNPNYNQTNASDDATSRAAVQAASTRSSIDASINDYLNRAANTR